jgi:hypothetical protein
MRHAPPITDPARRPAQKPSASAEPSDKPAALISRAARAGRLRHMRHDPPDNSAACADPPKNRLLALIPSDKPAALDQPSPASGRFPRPSEPAAAAGSRHMRHDPPDNRPLAADPLKNRLLR